MLDKLEINVLVNDPLKSTLMEGKKNNSKDGFEKFVEFEDVLQADIITFHTPLVRKGEFSTWHKINDDVLSKLSDQFRIKPLKNSINKCEKLIINTARGGVIDNAALLHYLTKNPGLQVILDVWENEPDINTDLMANCFLATPHIAGYSQDGKLSGTVMIYKAACDYFNIKFMKPEFVEKDVIPIRLRYTRKLHEPSFLAVSRLLNEVFPILEDDRLLRQINHQNTLQKGQYFDSLRKHYRIRREFRNYSIATEECCSEDIQILKALGFQLEE